jgi:F-box protein 9
MQPPESQTDEPEPEELVRFRQAWLKELEQANVGRPEPDHGRLASASKASYSEQEQAGPSSKSIAGSTTTSSSQTPHGTIGLNRGLTFAVDTYRRAVEFERKSQLHDALQLYQQAFRLDSNVDKAYYRAELQLQSATSIPGRGHEHKKYNSLSDTNLVDNLTRDVGALSVQHVAAGKGVVTGTLASILDKFPQDLKFEPEDERNGVPLRFLPDEVLVLVLRSLDPTTIERFAAVNRKARVISLDSGIWR